LVDLMIPRFETSSDLDINSILKKLGIRTAYDSIKADFSNFSSAQLWIDTVKHIANISVDEKGTEAAAVTVAMMAGATPDAPKPQFIEFHADRPFIFAITEKTTGAILFLGCYR
ncbi:MAG: serpin family protein, partial [Bacteroidales bacterium]|nr:serpin family protein [Bacteroidales bacterium]